MSKDEHSFTFPSINITEIGDYPLPLIEPLPINVGVYYVTGRRNGV